MAGWATDRLQIYIDADTYEGWLFTAKIKQGFDVDEYLSSIREYYRKLPPDRFPILATMAGNITGGTGANVALRVRPRPDHRRPIRPPLTPDRANLRLAGPSPT